MNNIYSNIPATQSSDSGDQTLRAFDLYFSQPLELKAGTFYAITGFFTSKGFDQQSSQVLASVIMKQAKQDGYNAMNVLDTIKGLSDAEISAFASEIINYNRFKSSYLGYALAFTPPDDIVRNIIA